MGENKKGPPRSTNCRFCGGAGEIYHGAHRSCLYRKQVAQKTAKRGANRCAECRVEIGYRRRLCDICRDRRRAETQRREDRERSPRVRPPKPPKPPRTRAPKQVKPATPPRVYVKRERQLAAPRVSLADLPATNPNGVEPRRIEPVGAAAWSVADARRFG